MIKPILSAAALSLLMSTAAWAMPHDPAGAQLASDVVKVGKDGHDRNDHGQNHRWHGNQANRDYDHRWDDGDDHYRSWHQYSYRPDDWDERGCVSIGPVWYCS
jgi:hypothetical protein